MNFSEDGDDWAGWRIPKSDVSVRSRAAPPGLAPVDNHLYLFAPRLFRGHWQQSTRVWAYEPSPVTCEVVNRPRGLET